MADREPARSFEDIIAWQKAHALVLAVYRVSRSFPQDELYGLTSQLRRAATSVPANIAEGFKKRSRPEKVRILNIAEASLEEARYYLRLAIDLEYMPANELPTKALEVARILGAYIAGIASRRP
jgi:four helix bundle protein